MDLEAVARRLSVACSPYWLTSISRLRSCLEAGPLTAKDAPQLLERTQRHARQAQKGRAANWLAAAWILDESRTTAWLRREGLLRASKYRYESAIPAFLAKATLARADELALSVDSRSWLINVESLLRVAPAARAEFNVVMRALRNEPYTFLQSCLITLDLLFMRAGFPEFDFGIPWTSEHDAKESLAEGFSLLWSHAHREVRITRLSAGLWDALGIYRGRYLRLLKRAASLREFSECEILIDVFRYGCTVDGEGAAVFTSPTPEIEKSIRLGYIGNSMRREKLRLEAQEQTGAASLRELGLDLHSALAAHGFIRVVGEDGPLPRVRFEIPLLPQLTDMLRAEGVAREELPGVAELGESFGMTRADAREYRVSDHLTLANIQQVQRLAIVTATCVARELQQRCGQPVILVNSTSPVYRTDEELDAFLEVTLEAAAARDFRELFRWPPDSADDPSAFDVQYRPLLEAEHEWHVPIFILAFSNLTRAALQLTRLRPNAASDFLEVPLVRTFQKAGHIAAANVRLRGDRGVVAELDVVALVDDTLVLLECKNSLLPCNTFELRRSHSACVEAARQLDRARAALQLSRHRDALLKRLDVPHRVVSHVATGIVAGNQLFSGARFGDHLVVSPTHLANFISGGSIVFGHGGALRSPLRPPGDLTAATLIDFLDGSFYERMFSAMVPTGRDVELGERRLRFETYMLDLIALGQAFGLELESLEELARGVPLKAET